MLPEWWRKHQAEVLTYASLIVDTRDTPTVRYLSKYLRQSNLLDGMVLNEAHFLDRRGNFCCCQTRLYSIESPYKTTVLLIDAVAESRNRERSNDEYIQKYHHHVCWRIIKHHRDDGWSAERPRIPQIATCESGAIGYSDFSANCARRGFAASVRGGQAVRIWSYLL